MIVLIASVIHLLPALVLAATESRWMSASAEESAGSEDWVAVAVSGPVRMRGTTDWFRFWPFDAWQTVVARDRIAAPIELVTGPGAEIVLSRGGDVVEIGGNSRVELAPAGNRAWPVVRQSRGTVWFTVDVASHPLLQVETPHLVAAARDTRYRVDVGPTRSRLSVQIGSVHVSTTDGGDLADVLSGRTVSVASTVGDPGDQPNSVAGDAVGTADGDGPGAGDRPAGDDRGGDRGANRGSDGSGNAGSDRPHE